MKAMIIEKFGDPSEFIEKNDIPKPVPKDNEVLVRIKAVGINAVDYKLRKNGSWSGTKLPAVSMILLLPLCIFFFFFFWNHRNRFLPRHIYNS